MTNYERIKQMSLEEMVDFIIHDTDGICGCCHNDIRFGVEKCCEQGLCTKGIKMWLESETAEADTKMKCAI